MIPWQTPADIRQRNPDMVALPELTEAELAFARRLFSQQLHLTWGITRMVRGFEYGPERTETTHPNLVQYEDLPQQQQEFDEQDAITTMRVLKGMGVKFDLTNVTQGVTG